jgi:uncharacterized protein DUF4325
MGSQGTRRAGAQLPIKVLNLLTAKPKYYLYINWDGVSVIASSFADEFLGKLVQKLGKAEFERKIRLTNMEPLVKQLVEKAISERIADEPN